MGTAEYRHYHWYRDNSSHCFYPCGLGTGKMVSTLTFDYIHNRKLGIGEKTNE